MVAYDCSASACDDIGLVFVLVHSYDVFLQTRRYSSSRVREVVTRDMRTSLGFGTDRKLPFPVIVDYVCPWEPHDSATGPGILYLAAEVTGEPTYVEFGPEASDGEESQLVEKPWSLELKDVWGEIQEHYADRAFTEERQQSIERFFRSFPWGGLSQLHPFYRPPFCMPVFQEGGEEPAALDPAQQLALDSVGPDPEGNMRLGFAEGRDVMDYSLAMSRPTFGKAELYLDGTKRVARQRKRKGERVSVGSLHACIMSLR